MLVVNIFDNPTPIDQLSKETLILNTKQIEE